MSADLCLRGLRKRVADLTIEAEFAVASAERLALMGPSGCGKTTLLRVLAGLEALDAGSLVTGGRSIERLPPEERGMGLVFQDQALFTHLSVLENAAFGLEMRGAARAEREAEARSWLERVGLGARLATPVSRLSGGERQRLALVRAWIWKPQAILLDEPFSALDPATRASLRALVVELHQAHPVPLVFVTHDEEDARAIATSRILCSASLEPPSVRRFVREIP